MKFGEIPTTEAEGAVLAHSVCHATGVFKKGRGLTASDIALLAESGISKVFAARLGDDDVPEDEAAQAIAARICGANVSAREPFTGRVNLYAGQRGLAVLDMARVNALNGVHESLTLATVGSFNVVDPQQIIATVKIIPFAVPRKILDRALAVIGDEPLVRVAELRAKRVGLVITKLARVKTSILEKSEASMRARVTALGSEISDVIVCNHTIEAVQNAVSKLHDAMCDPILVFGASAIVDRGDVVPASVAAAGGEVIHLGMPVDPGNLMMLGNLRGVPVIGVPSCARSPKVNGFDFVLQRVLAGLDVTSHDITNMGAGGLLAEIPSRPLPRESK
jgi:molybdenum cofactor cytidylyltransferase